MSVSGVIGNHWALSLSVLFFQSLDLVLLHIYSAEYEIYHRSYLLYIFFSVENSQLADGFRDRLSHSPLASDSVFKLFACRAGGSRNANNVEPRVFAEQQRKSLTDHARSADDTYIKFLHQKNSFSFAFARHAYRVCQNYVQSIKNIETIKKPVENPAIIQYNKNVDINNADSTPP